MAARRRVLDAGWDGAGAVSDIERDKEEIIECGRMPKKRDGSVDLYRIDRLLLELDQTRERVAVLRRLLEAKA